MKARPQISISRSLQRLVVVQNRVCPSCGGTLPLHGQKAEYWRWPTRDHVWPRSRGGQVIVAMHRRCNFEKQDREPTGCEILFATLVTAVVGAPA